MSNQAIAMSAEDRPRSLNVLGEQITVLAAAEQTGSFEVFFQSGPEGSGPPPHSHDWDEAFYILRGEVTFVVDGEAHIAGPGAFAHVPGGTVHLFQMGPGGAEMLSLTSAVGAADMFTAIDRAASSTEDLDVAGVVAIVTAHGATVALPPAEEAVDA